MQCFMPGAAETTNPMYMDGMNIETNESVIDFFLQNTAGEEIIL